MKNNILDLIDFEKVNILLEGFNKATGFVTAVLDLDGKVLFRSGWRQICTDFHRVNPQTSQRCTRSDTQLAGALAEGEKYHYYKCLNGLVDVAVPIVVNGEHIANLFSGQFFFEEPDIEFFKKQAKKYGFDENKYLEALEKVPVVSMDKVQITMDFLKEMTLLISEMTYQRLEQIELNEALTKSNRLIHNIIDNTTSLFYLVDTDGKIQLVNKRYEYLFNARAEELIGKPREAFIPPKIARQHRNNDLKVIKSKHSIQFEETNVESDGIHYYLTQKFPLFDLNNEVYAVGGISSDITEFKNAEELLKESEERFRKVFDEGPIGMVMANLTTRKMFNVNKAFCTMLGYTKEELLNITFSSITHPDDRSKDMEPVKNLYEGKIEVYKADKRYIKKNGEIIWASLALTRIYSEKNKTYYSLAMVEDITQRKHAEDEVRTQLNELRRWYEVTLDREGRVMELKKEVNELLAKAGMPLRYASEEKALQSQSKDEINTLDYE